MVAAGLAYHLHFLEGEAVCLTRLKRSLCPSVIECRYPQIDSKNLLGLRVGPTWGRCLSRGSNFVT